jgi:hypothetical protein
MLQECRFRHVIETHCFLLRMEGCRNQARCFRTETVMVGLAYQLYFSKSVRHSFLTFREQTGNPAPLDNGPPIVYALRDAFAAANTIEY